MDIKKNIKIMLIALILLILYCIYDNKELFSDDFPEPGKFDINIIFFYSDNCFECKKIKEPWYQIKENINNRLTNAYKIRLFEVNGDLKPLTVKNYNITHYPSVIFLYQNKKLQIEKYNGPLSYISLTKSINNIYKNILSERTMDMIKSK
jgi:hypothetical protein